MADSEKMKVLIADDEDGIRFVLKQLLVREGCEVDEATNGAEAIKLAEKGPHDLYLFDVRMPKVEGLEVLKRIRSLYPDALAVMITAFGSQKLAHEALVAGAYDYFTKPFELEELRITLRRALSNRALLKKVEQLEQQLDDGGSASKGMIGKSPAMKRVFDLIDKVAGHEITVLITGESGVGKEMVAEAVHRLGPGSDKPFIKVNCAAIPEPLLESELFGHDKGAFTGAVSAKPGKFEIADGGSILLDEIGEMPLAIQAKLLRVLQEKQVERVGENFSRPVNVRIMAATNRDLADMVREKTFREDLYFRINVVSIYVPPLRERPEDLVALVNHFIRKYSGRVGKRIDSTTPEAMRRIENHNWPGNIRELENAIQRAIVLTPGNLIDIDALPPTVSESTGQAIENSPSMIEAGPTADEIIKDATFTSLSDYVDNVVEREEKALIEAALRKKNFHRQETADLLGISRKSLHNKMAKYDIAKKKK